MRCPGNSFEGGVFRTRSEDHVTRDRCLAENGGLAAGCQGQEVLETCGRLHNDSQRVEGDLLKAPVPG